MRKIIIILLAAVMATTGWMVSAQQAMGSGFTDVPKGDKYEQYIYRLKELNIIDSKGGSTFGYNRKSTRAEFLNLLMKTMGFSMKVTTRTSIFKDVKTTDKYYPAINKYEVLHLGFLVECFITFPAVRLSPHS